MEIHKHSQLTISIVVDWNKSIQWFLPHTYSSGRDVNLKIDENVDFHWESPGEWIHACDQQWLEMVWTVSYKKKR